MIDTTKIIGRYAPSPTGDLHLGNLRTALLAWLGVRLQEGIFLMRMDDLDQLREVDGSAAQILRDIEWLGLDWDGEVVYQSQRTELYQQAMQNLEAQELVYPCFCSRKDIQHAASAPHAQYGLYPGICTQLDASAIKLKQQKKSPAFRVRVGTAEINFCDQCLGDYRDELRKSCGDFVIKRADGLFAYQLATAVDDIDQGVTEVVRGADLIDSTARQIYLMNRLNTDFSEPVYWHVPLMLNDEGERMAKRDGSLSIEEWRSSNGTAAGLIGFLAASINLIDRPDAISAQELLAQLTLKKWQETMQIVSPQ